MRNSDSGRSWTLTLRPLTGVPNLASSRQIKIQDDRVLSVESIAASGAGQLFVLPALVNAHDHGRPVRTSSIGAGGKPLETWLHYQMLIPPVDPYLAAVVSFARSSIDFLAFCRASSF